MSRHDPVSEALYYLGGAADPLMATIRLLYLWHATPNTDVRLMHAGLRNRHERVGRNGLGKTSHAWPDLVALVPELEPSTLDDLAVLAVLSKLASIKISYDGDASYNTLGTVYEGLLPGRERRKLGVRYTPCKAAEVVRMTLRPLLHTVKDALDVSAKLLDLRVCDPTVGSGAVLIELVRYLGDLVYVASQREGLTGSTVLCARRAVALQCVHGVGKDARTAEVARLSLRIFTKSLVCPDVQVSKRPPLIAGCVYINRRSVDGSMRP